MMRSAWVAHSGQLSTAMSSLHLPIFVPGVLLAPLHLDDRITTVSHWGKVCGRCCLRLYAGAFVELLGKEGANAKEVLW